MTSTSADKDKNFCHTFWDACEAGNSSQVQEALASDQLTPKIRNEGFVAAVLAGINPGVVDVISALLAAGEPITPRVRDAVHGENFEQSPAVLRLLFDNGLDPNASQSRDFEPADSLVQTGGEPLLNFINDPACAREFLSRGADPNITGPRGETALYKALEDQHVDMAEMLIEYGTKLEPNFLFTTIHLRWRGPDTGIRERMTKFLLDHGVDPNQATSETWGTPLHLAAFYDNADIVKMLLDAGADRKKKVNSWRFSCVTAEQLLLKKDDKRVSWA
ncbi:hypothetical protein ONS95_014976 [Cadophora gregata]|uniref:uncharacterized protein n=1 Tax=Cadophora gregata TaxID=51156 RepID=UPI0026DDCB3A|nr:uncharacterized protein ONS95_014976 [Cadophora gregata]KAK0103179.1 hypothetical protein ONS96_005785 [Cadophora gregata f. sp. sojae]KAK0113282.1 hypothetical protein ONS95_014976 [Cadophora gregata]